MRALEGLKALNIKESRLEVWSANKRALSVYNAIQYDINHPRPDVIVIYAMWGNEVAAMAGSSADSSLMWQIGIDVSPKFRNKGLATSLVSNLAIMIMERGVVPYYGTASSNIESQAVAMVNPFGRQSSWPSIIVNSGK